MQTGLGSWGPGQALIWGGTHVVRSPKDLPAAVGGIHTLPAGRTWYFTGNVDLLGNRIICDAPTAIVGASAETTTLRSTGLTGQPLIESFGTLQMRTITLHSEAGADCVDIDGDASTALDWQYVNFTGGKAGTIFTINNFVGDGLALLGASGLTFEGGAASIVLTNSILVPSGGAGLLFEPAATVTRRFRLTNCAAVVTPGNTGIMFDAPTIEQPEGFILDGVNFSGGGTYVDGLTYLSDFARFIECRGIINSTRLGALYWTGNATATVNPGAGISAKVAGVSVASAVNQRFAHSDNRLTYASALQAAFFASATVTLAAGNNNQVTMELRLNGVAIDGSAQTVTTNASGRVENATLQAIFELVEGDYIEVWCANAAVTNVKVVDLTLIVRVL